MRRLVIVADNSLIVQSIRIGFGHSGDFNLVGRADGRRATAETIIDARPDVILFDDMDRSERTPALIREIKAKDDTVAVIVLSLHLDAVWLQRLFDSGAIAAISKATQPVALATLVRETASGHIYRRCATANEAAEPPPEVASSEELPLTARELEILKLVAAGFTDGDIARRLWVTEQTVKFQLRHVYRKLRVTNRTDATQVAFVRGMTGVASEPALPALPARASCRMS